MKARTVLLLVAVSTFVSVVSFAQHLPRRSNYIIEQSRRGVTIRDLPAAALGTLPEHPARGLVPEVPVQSRISPIVERWIRERSPRDVVEVMVLFDDDGPAPVLPALNPRHGRTDEVNRAVVRQREAILNTYRTAREQDHRRRLAGYGPGAAHMATFIAANVMTAAVPLATIPRIVADRDVRFVQPTTSNEPPPALPELTPNHQTGIAMMQTNFWSWTNFPASGYRDSWLRIALADTGVRATHTLLSGAAANRIGLLRDCFAGTQAYCTSPVGDPYDRIDHGTGAAAILSGNSYPNSYRGVTWYTINSYKIYNDGTGGLDYPAAIRAVDAAIANGDEILVFEAQGIAANDQGLAEAADAAARVYGITVVAANGNGPIAAANDSLPRSPGVARNVLAVGWVDAMNGYRGTPQSQGPTPDNRIKPDILAPSWVYTASNAADDGSDAITSATYGGTSGAAAFAGGLAAVIFNIQYDSWADPGLRADAPGRHYAAAIAYGDNRYIDNINGAGIARTPGDWCQFGDSYYGEVTLNSSTQVVEIPIRFWPDSGCSLPANRIDAAIWWSELSTAPHLGVNLFLVNPSGTVIDGSTHGSSVFQKVRYTGSDAGSGQWKLRIVATRIPDRPTRLYYHGRIATW